MKRTILFSVLTLILAAASARAAQAQSEAARPENASKKTITLSGVVGPEGKTLVGKGNRLWMVANPAVLAATEGRSVTVRARMNANANEIVVSVVRLREERTTAKLDDVAFRR